MLRIPGSGFRFALLRVKGLGFTPTANMSATRVEGVPRGLLEVFEGQALSRVATLLAPAAPEDVFSHRLPPARR